MMERTAIGTVIGCAFAAVGLWLAATFGAEAWPAGAIFLAPFVVPFVFLFTILLAGPGAVVMGLPVSWLLHRVAERTGSRNLTQLVAIVLCVPLAILNLWLIHICLGLPQGMTLGWIAGAAAGGLGAAYGATLARVPPRPALPPTNPTAFFDGPTRRWERYALGACAR